MYIEAGLLFRLVTICRPKQHTASSIHKCHDRAYTHIHTHTHTHTEKIISTRCVNTTSWESVASVVQPDSGSRSSSLVLVSASNGNRFGKRSSCTPNHGTSAAKNKQLTVTIYQQIQSRMIWTVSLKHPLPSPSPLLNPNNKE